MFCLGKNPARPDAIKLKLADFLAGTTPIYPKEFGHEEWNPPIDWGMLGNDQYGDCVLAGAAHETMLWNKIAGHEVKFTAADCLADQQAITGLPPGPLVGTDVAAACRYRLKTGVRDSQGNRHKVAAYLGIKPGDMNELLTACYLFGAVGLGVQLHRQDENDFVAHRAWGSSVSRWFFSRGMYLGGHYVPVVAYRGGNIVVVTWGRFQSVRPSWFIENCDEAVAYLSQEDLVNGKSPEGFDYQGLIKKMGEIRSQES